MVLLHHCIVINTRPMGPTSTASLVFLCPESENMDQSVQDDLPVDDYYEVQLSEEAALAEILAYENFD